MRVCVGHARNAGQVPPDAFVREIPVDGDLSDEQHGRLIEIADRCPVHQSLEQGARISTLEVSTIGLAPCVESAGPACSGQGRGLERRMTGRAGLLQDSGLPGAT